jgi:hypothetical protein
MVSRAIAIVLLCGVLFAAKTLKTIGNGSAENADVEVKATIFADGDAVNQLLGSTLDGHYIVVNIQLNPKSKLTVDFDNFMLRTDKDGEKSHPFKPTQIAGDGALVISDPSQGDENGKKRHGPTFSGGMGGMGGGGASNTTTGMGNKSTMQEATGRRNPLLNQLTDRMLEEKETDQSIIGLLYFPMEKQKMKDLELIITTASGKVSLRFKTPN